MKLHTPLTAILWNLELILKEGAGQTTKKELLDGAYQKAVFIRDHFDDMITALQFEKEKNAFYLKKELADFENLFEETLKSMAEEIKNKNIGIKVEKFDYLRQFPFDARKIRKVFLILLKNAVAYSPDGEEIKIKCEIKIINHKKNAVFSINDSGIGITEDEKCNIFSKFYRCEEAQKISPNGFGLGLFIVKKFIEAHGGETWFDSKGKGKGATFYFSLPME